MLLTLTSSLHSSHNLTMLKYYFIGLLAFIALKCNANSCPDTQLAVYKLELKTHWNRDIFTKQYPEFRPAAQWSRLVGRTHGSKFHIFSVGELVSPALRIFAEKGITDGMDEQSQGISGVYDNFGAEAIKQGEGETRAKIFLDGNHTKVSLVVRMVPSPDWFIGVDAVDLCDKEGNWIDKLTIQLDPLDAGTDNGFTFTSPNWPTDPQQPVTIVTSKQPDHPASSFFYPEMERLPHIASLHLHKSRVYKLSKEFTHQQQTHSRVLTSEDLEEMSNQLTGDLHAKHRTAGTIRPYLSSDVTTSRTPVSTTRRNTVTVKSTTATPRYIPEMSTRARNTPPTRGSLISAGFHVIPHHHHLHKKPEEKLVFKSTGSSTYQQLHRVAGVHFYRPEKTPQHPPRLHNQEQSTTDVDSQKRQQRIRAIRRRKIAAQRRLRNQLEAAKQANEFLTVDGGNFDSN